MKTIRVTIITMLLALPIKALAQTNSISYSYDASGNRIGRSITISPVKERDATDVADIEEDVESRICITADADAGTVRVEITGYEDTDRCRIILYDTNGIIHIDTTATEAVTIIDLNGKPAGVYVLHTVLNGKKTTWKIAYR